MSSTVDLFTLRPLSRSVFVTLGGLEPIRELLDDGCGAGGRVRTHVGRTGAAVHRDIEFWATTLLQQLFSELTPPAKLQCLPAIIQRARKFQGKYLDTARGVVVSAVAGNGRMCKAALLICSQMISAANGNGNLAQLSDIFAANGLAV